MSNLVIVKIDVKPHNRKDRIWTSLSYRSMLNLIIVRVVLVTKIQMNWKCRC